jgi:penicillin-binding protein 1A
MMEPFPQPLVSRPGQALPRKPWQLLLIGFFGSLVSGVLLAAAVALVLVPTLPSLDSISDNPLKVPLRVYSAEGILLGEFGDEKRIPVTTAEVPEKLVQAILAAEDHSFYYHQGVDFLGIARAAWSNMRSGRTGEGASTITMQVARNYFLTPEKTYTRKLKEILLAFKLERDLTKYQILELYLNKIFLGNRAYGFAAAAQIYYGKSLNELTLPEMATLAGVPKAPSRNNPLSNPESATERRNYVLRHMFKLGFIEQADYTEALDAPVGVSKHSVRYTVEAPYVAEMVRQYMLQTYAENAYGGGYHVYTTIRAAHQQAANAALRTGVLEYDRRHGYRGPAGRERLGARIGHTEMDGILKEYSAVGQLLPAIVTAVHEKSMTAYTQEGIDVVVGWSGLAWAQAHITEDSVGPPPKTARDVVQTGDVVYLDQTKDGEWQLSQTPRAAGAIVALNPNDGTILALAGGFDFYQSSFNRVLQAQRQPGSSLKPFVYSAALEKGFTAASTISGAPIVVQDVSLEDEWRPEDYSRQFYGPTRLRKALALSLNLVSVRLLRAIGPEYAAQYMERFGFDPKKLPANLSLVLGAIEATPLDMARAFAVFANGGYRITPYFIERVEDAKQNVLERAPPVVTCEECPPADPDAAGNDDGAPVRHAERTITPENAFIMTSILRDVITAGTGQSAQVLGRKDLAGKTGTTNDHRDAWFSGYNADLVVTAWLGFDQPAPLGKGETGGRAALPMWIDYMRTTLDGVPEKPLVRPPGVISAPIHRDSGRLTDANDPQALQEYFIEGTLAGAGGEGEDGGAQPKPALPENLREGLF